MTTPLILENCRLCQGIGRSGLGGACSRCRGTGRQVRDAYSPESAIDAPSAEEVEIARVHSLADEYRREWQSAVERADASHFLHQEAAKEVESLRTLVADLERRLEARDA